MNAWADYCAGKTTTAAVVRHASKKKKNRRKRLLFQLKPSLIPPESFTEETAARKVMPQSQGFHDWGISPFQRFQVECSALSITTSSPLRLSYEFNLGCNALVSLMYVKLVLEENPYSKHGPFTPTSIASISGSLRWMYFLPSLSSPQWTLVFCS